MEPIQTASGTRAAVLQRIRLTAQTAAQLAARLLTYVGQLLIVSVLAAGWLTYTMALGWQWHNGTAFIVFLLLSALPLLTLGSVYWALQTLVALPAQLSDLINRTHANATTLQSNLLNTPPTTLRWSDIFTIGATVVELKSISDEVTELMPVMSTLAFLISPLFIIALVSGAGMTVLLFMTALIAGI